MTSHSASELVGQRVKAYRVHHGWTAQQLAKRCAEAGASEISAAVIANIETGRRDASGRRRRDVTIDEVLKLAYALGVSPIALFTPLAAGEGLAITPTVAEKPFEALLWVTGRAKPANVSRADWNKSRAEITLYQRIFDTIQETTEDEGDEAFGAHLKNLAMLMNLAVDTGLEPPELPDKWISRMQAERWLKRGEE
jgi:transcriptional regulator with XRE-family HTH domain